MRQKMARQFCQMKSLKTTYHNALSLELNVFAEPFRKYFSLKILNFSIKNIENFRN